jgi:hypothetical protein
MMDDRDYKRWSSRKEPLDSDEWKRSPSKQRRKLRKKFCRGIAGKQHVKVLKKSSWGNGRPCGAQASVSGYTWNVCYHRVVCAECGKVLHYSLPVAGISCKEAWENDRKRYEAEQPQRMAEFRKRYVVSSM